MNESKAGGKSWALIFQKLQWFSEEWRKGSRIFWFFLSEYYHYDDKNISVYLLRIKKLETQFHDRL